MGLSDTSRGKGGNRERDAKGGLVEWKMMDVSGRGIQGRKG